jgi:hypothetical protein
MTTNHTLVSDLAKEVQPPDKGILSRTPYNDDRLGGTVLKGRDVDLGRDIAVKVLKRVQLATT